MSVEDVNDDFEKVKGNLQGNTDENFQKSLCTRSVLCMCPVHITPPAAPHGKGNSITVESGYFWSPGHSTFRYYQSPPPP